ncbi:MFS transporter [Amorphus orientalis]|uniref:MFS family permease n=1 Tax=Amorphus orientalis TaxID=649198 RepID=A0AAE4AS16_9HYPH|nr:MFS transporter [Amorphus orientalis]MDQ0313619.1 MFS family permease [Amorphus orientalis]
MTQTTTRAFPIGQLLPLCLLVFVDAMGFAMIVPILASNPLSDNPLLQSILYGIAVGIYPLATFFAAPLLGVLSDRKGRLPIMLLCGAGLIASYAGIAIGFEVGSPTLVIVGRLVGGLTAATQALALAALSDLGDRESKDARINLGLLASSLGFVLGPLLSGVLAQLGGSAQFDRIAPLVAVMALAAVTLGWLATSYPDKGAPERVEDNPLDFLGSVRELRLAVASPVLRRLSAIFLLQQLAWGGFFFFMATFLISRFAMSNYEVSYFMGVLGVGFCLSFAVVTPLLRKAFAAYPVALGAMIVTTVCIAVAAAGQSAHWEWLLAIPISTGVAVAYGAVISLFTDQADGNEGGILGVTASINALAFGLTSLAGGVIAGGAAVGPIVFAAILMAASTLLLTGLRKNRG